MYVVFATSLSPVTMVKPHKKKCQNCFRLTTSDHFTTHWNSTYSMVKCFRNINFAEIDTELSTEQKVGFWLLKEIFQEYIKQNFIIAVLTKANFYSVDMCQLIKNQ